MLATSLDDEVKRHLASGKHAILLIQSSDALPQDAGFKATHRAGSELDGRWFSNFNWIRSDSALFREISFGRILGFESAEVAPGYVIEDVAPGHFDDVLCGATFGWLQKNSALALQAQVGNGRLVATTFRFDAYGNDAYATALLNSLIQYVASDSCQPKLRLDAIKSLVA